MIKATNSKTEQYLEERYSNTWLVRYKAGDSNIEIRWLAKVEDAGEKHRKKTTTTNSNTEQHLEEGYSNTRQVRSEVGDSERERDMC